MVTQEYRKIYKIIIKPLKKIDNFSQEHFLKKKKTMRQINKSKI